MYICWSAKLTLNHNGSNIKYCWHWINVLHSTNYLREIWHSAFFTSGDYDIMVWQICRFSLRVNFPGSDFFFWRQSSFLGKFAVSNYPGALFPDGKIAPGKLAPDSKIVQHCMKDPILMRENEYATSEKHISKKDCF